MVNPRGRSAQPRSRRGAVLPWAIVILVAVLGCDPSSPRPAAVAGKVAYRGMGIEEARLAADRRGPAGWEPAGITGRSGYHGSFLLHLPAGTWRIRATADLADGPDTRTVRGATGPVTVGPDTRRIDRVVVELE